MHDGWHEQLPDRTRDDIKAWAQFGLALVGAGMVFGSLLGGTLGLVWVAAGALDDQDFDQ